MVCGCWKWLFAGLMLSVVCGCQRSPEASRTYSEDQDGQVVVAPASADQMADVEPATEPQGHDDMRSGGASSTEALSSETPAADSPAGAMVAAANAADSGSSSPMPSAAGIPSTESSRGDSDGDAKTADAAAVRSANIEVLEDVALKSGGAGTAAMVQSAAERLLQERDPAPATPRKVELLIPEKEFSRVAPDNSLRVSYDDIDLLKVLNMEPVPPDCVDYFPDWLKALDGQQIRIRGFMFPPLRETNLSGFVLARDNQICCFGRFPKIYDVFPVTMAEGVTTDYIPNRPFDVVGRFHIRPEVYRGELENLYEIEDARVITN